MKKIIYAIFASLSIIFFSSQVFPQNSSNKTSSSSKSSNNLTSKKMADINPETDYLAKSGNSVNAVAWSNTRGGYFATSWNNSTILFESETNNIAAIYSNSADNKLNAFTDITKIIFSPDNSTILSVHNNNTAMVHSIESSRAALITGTGRTIADAVYAGSSNRLIIPIDEKILYECTRENDRQNFTLEKEMSFQKKIIALASNGEDGKLFVTFEDGNVSLIDTNTWKILEEMKTFSANRIYPEFSNDNIHFLHSQDNTHIVVSNINNLNERRIIKDSDYFVNSAIFSADGKSIIAATKSGYVRIYEISTGRVTHEFRLASLDTAKSIATSPDGEFVLIGTAKGYIYRWSLNGYEFNKDEKKYYNDDGKEYHNVETEQKKSDKKDSEQKKSEKDEKSVVYINGTSFQIRSGTYAEILLGLRNEPNPYAASAEITFSLINYDWLHPFFTGASLSPYLGLPKSEYPYSYYDVSGAEIESPLLAGAEFRIPFGFFIYPFSEKGIGLSAEIFAGAGTSFLWNRKFANEAVTSKLFFSFFAGANIAVYWKFLKIYFGAEYDSVQKILINGGIGCSLRIKRGEK